MYHITNYRPSAAEHHPSITLFHFPNISHQPKANRIDHQLPTTDQSPHTTNYPRSTTNYHPPAANYPPPTIDNQLSSTNCHTLATYCDPLPTTDHQPRTAKYPPTTTNCHAPASSEIPITDHQPSITSDQLPATYYRTIIKEFDNLLGTFFWSRPIFL